jgi:hypothetical protein
VNVDISLELCDDVIGDMLGQVDPGDHDP